MRRATVLAVPVHTNVLVYLQPFRRNSPLSVHRSRKSPKTLKHYFGGSRSFKVINVYTAKKLVTSACCLSNAMHSIGQSIKSPECPCLRASVRASNFS